MPNGTYLLKTLVVVLVLALASSCTTAPTTAGETTPNPNLNQSEAKESMSEGGGSVGDFTLKNLDGQSVSLSDFLGENVIVISYWAMPCDHCKKEMVPLHELYLKYKNRGLTVLSISTDGPETIGDVRPYVKQRGYTFPVLLDTESVVTQLFNPKGGKPFTLLISKDQEIVWEHDGYVPGDERLIEDEILKALEGEGE